MPPDHEFGFELRVCAWAERAWPPGSERDDAERVVVARQLGTRRRRWDTVVVETSADLLRRRARFGPRALDSDLLHVVRHAPAEWAWYREALPDPGYPWRYVREAVHRAADRGVVETRRAGNRVELRRKWTYPEWAERVVAVENKPDLDASAADALVDQLQRDVALALADEVWVATEAAAGTDAGTGAGTGTGSGTEPGTSARASVEPILLERVPVEAGVLAFDHGAGPTPTASVEWFPRSLAVDDLGTRVRERPAGGAHDQSAARFEYADPSWKAERRRVVAERAYERGWRSFVEAMRPDCRHFTVATDPRRPVPRCRAKGCEQTAAECAGDCPQFEPEPPPWRTRGWPIEGGPGARVKQVLARQRRRRRPGLEE